MAVTVFHDITEHEQAHSDHTRLAALVESSDDAIIGKDLDAVITCWNPGAERLYGYAVDEMIGRSIALLVPPDVPDELPAILARIRRGEPVEHLETVRVRKDGTRIEVSITVSPIRDASGAVTGAAAVERDISDRKEAEAERARRLAQEEIVRAKDELVSIVSHELRTPLVSLVGFAELMLARDFAEAERREFLTIMLREGQRLGALINDFLDLQRMESGRLQIVPEANDLREIAAWAIAAAGEDPDRPIVVDLPADLPPVAADDERILQVLANLLSNARKYSPGGGEVRVTARVADGSVEVGVSDRGLGIPDEALPQIFEKFYRVDNSDRRRIGGTGLGLAICRQIVAAHGGRIWAESPGLGQGATVRFTLPIATAPPPAGDVLVVEDDEGFARLLEAELAGLGLSAVRVTTAEAALARVHRAPAPRAVVLDLLLPGLQGEAFLARANADGAPGVPIVVVTVKEVSLAARSELERLGVVAVFHKGSGVAAQAARAVGGAIDRGAEA
jgi:PAS domain S-box-containing protein